MTRLAATALVALVLLVAFEAVLYEAALFSFSHLDTPGCAGSNTFCSPRGEPGPTGGAVVFAAGNAAALAVTAAVGMTVAVRRARAGRPRS